LGVRPSVCLSHLSQQQQHVAGLLLGTLRAGDIDQFYSCGQKAFSSNGTAAAWCTVVLSATVAVYYCSSKNMTDFPIYMWFPG